jgi:transposase-like protein
MKRKAEKVEAKQEGRGGASSSLGQVLEPLVEGLVSTRQRLFDWIHVRGLQALDAVFREEAVALAGPKGKHDPHRTHHHWGAAPRELTLGGRRVSVPCPRVRSTDGQEALLPSITVFRARDPLEVRVMEQLLLGVSTRGFDRSLGDPPAGVPSRGSSKSAVSRNFVTRTRSRVAAELTRRLEGLDVVALLVDGVQVGGETAIVAMAVTADGQKEPVGLSLGSTENAVLCTQLVQGLLERGLTTDGRVLCVIDGGKGLRKALVDVLGDAAVIQRCQLHKMRNLAALVPKARQVYVRSMMRRAYKATSAKSARQQLQALVGWLEANGHVDAAASLREGLEETLTVVKLGLPPSLVRFFVTTNCIENLISTLRHVTRNVKRWRGGAMIQRWAGLGLLEARAGFRRIKGHRELGKLAAALRGAGDSATRAA